jgi:histidine triad (HIT) family protein
MSEDCLFCKIADGTIPANVTFEDDRLIAINDISPQAPVHQLIMPRKHIATVNDIEPDDQTLLGHMITTAKDLAAEQNLSERGYRLILNCNQEGGQTVFHIHLHLLGGRQLIHLG